MDVYDVADELELIAQKPPKFDVAVMYAPRLMALARYASADGADLLVKDIGAAITQLPPEKAAHATVLLKLEATADSNWSRRIKEIDESDNGGGRKQYARLILMCVAHALCQIWHQDDSPGKQRVFEPFERISYENRLEIDPEDHRKFTEHRDIHLRVAAPAQRLITLPYYYLVPAEPKVEPLTTGFTHITSFPSPETRWGTHILSLPRMYEIGEPIQLQTRERFQDRRRKLLSLNPQHGLHQLVAVASPKMSFIHIGVWLPPVLAAQAKPEALIITQDPFNQEIDIYEPEIEEDGWVNARFDQGLELGCKCLLRFPGLNPYA